MYPLHVENLANQNILSFLALKMFFPLLFFKFTLIRSLGNSMVSLAILPFNMSLKFKIFQLFRSDSKFKCRLFFYFPFNFLVVDSVPFFPSASRVSFKLSKPTFCVIIFPRNYNCYLILSVSVLFISFILFYFHYVGFFFFFLNSYILNSKWELKLSGYLYLLNYSLFRRMIFFCSRHVLFFFIL